MPTASSRAKPAAKGKRASAKRAPKSKRVPKPKRASGAGAFRALAAKDWPAVETLFGAKGACAGCWCMYWRQDNATWLKSKGAPNKRSFRTLIGQNHVHAALAFSGGEPIGWCCIGAHEEFPRLSGARTLQRPRPPGAQAGDIWSVVCFFIRADWRGKKIASRLLETATALAFQRGAREVEGYPVVIKPGKTMPAVFAYTGTEAMFRAAGYARIDNGEAGRAIYLKGLGSARPPSRSREARAPSQ